MARKLPATEILWEEGPSPALAGGGAAETEPQGAPSLADISGVFVRVGKLAAVPGDTGPKDDEDPDAPVQAAE